MTTKEFLFSPTRLLFPAGGHFSRLTAGARSTDHTICQQVLSWRTRSIWPIPVLCTSIVGNHHHPILCFCDFSLSPKRRHHSTGASTMTLKLNLLLSPLWPKLSPEFLCWPAGQCLYYPATLCDLASSSTSLFSISYFSQSIQDPFSLQATPLLQSECWGSATVSEPCPGSLTLYFVLLKLLPFAVLASVIICSLTRMQLPLLCSITSAVEYQYCRILLAT